jgi:hypothetical protein
MRETGMSLEEISRLSRGDIEIILAELPRLEAQEALLATQISAFPHWSGSKNDKSAGDRARRDFTRKLQKQAYGNRHDYTPTGQRVLNNADDMRRWLSEGNVIYG